MTGPFDHAGWPLVTAMAVLFTAATAFAQQVPKNQPPLPKDDSEKAILAVIHEMDTTHRDGNMNVPNEDARLLRILAESTGAKNVVELGTSNGYSGLWFCLALRKTGGHLTTYDIDQDRFNQAKANFEKAGVSSLVTQVFGDAHEKVKELPDDFVIDILFIDADKPGYPDYLEKLLPKVRPGGIILAHNMARPVGNPDYVEAVTTDPNLDTIFVHMDNAGMAVSIKKR
jgi:predicted O-methyltransferase YrrM